MTRPAGRLLLLAAAWLLLPGLAGAAASPPAVLEPYLALASSPQGRELLAGARRAMEDYFEGARPGEKAQLPRAAGGAPGWPGAPVGVFVSLTRGGATRACVGSATPLGGTLAETVGSLAVQALHTDRRHPPVRRDELPESRIVIAFAGPGEAVQDPMAVQPAREGLLVVTPRGTAAFLPGEARTVSWALRQARRIGVLGPGEDATYLRFQVVTLAEPARAVEGSDEMP